MSLSCLPKITVLFYLSILLSACSINPPPEDVCSAEQFETPGIHRCGLMQGEELRWFQIYVPTGYDGDASALVVDLHGAGSPITFGNSAQQYVVSHFDLVAEDNNFIAVWPQGRNMTWLHDHEFVLSVVDEVEQLLNIDSKRIYVTGVSNGGAFAHELGCHYPDRFAAIAPVAAPISPVFMCEPEYSIPVMTVHAPTDWLVPYEGSLFFYSAEETFVFWAEKNGCVSEPEIVLEQGKSICREYDSCNDGVAVKFCSVDSKGLFLGGHLPYQNNDGVKVSAGIWEFFNRYSLP